LAIDGFIEATTPLQVRGWAWDAQDPEGICQITVCVADRPVAAATAHLFRDDLQRAQIGSGAHGFVINLPEPLAESELAELRVFAAGADGEAFQIVVAAPPPAAAAPSRRVVLEGRAVTDVGQRPVFILGAARSGTSAVAQALLASGAFEGAEEGHVFELMAKLLGCVTAYYGANGDQYVQGWDTGLARVAPDYFRAGIREMFVRLSRELFPSGRWLDKTPTVGIIQVTPILQEIWPAARFVFMWRGAVDNIASRLRKFPQLSFAAHCEDWASVMRAWLAVRSGLGAAVLEIEQPVLAREPGPVADQLAAFLDLDSLEARRMREALEVDRPEQTGTVFGETITLAQTGWTEEQVQIYHAVCGPVIAALEFQ
jgi:hypothetical protein